MAKTACTIPVTQIILDEKIYPRNSVSPKRVSMFAENIRDGFKIDPIEVSNSGPDDCTHHFLARFTDLRTFRWLDG